MASAFGCEVAGGVDGHCAGATGCDCDGRVSASAEVAWLDGAVPCAGASLPSAGASFAADRAGAVCVFCEAPGVPGQASHTLSFD